MSSKPEKVFQGSGVSPGVALGQALKFDNHNRVILKMHIHNAEEEAARFLRAIETSKEQLEAVKSQLEEKVGSEHSYILDAHLLMLEDKTLIAEILANIRTNNLNAEWAIRQATDRLLHAYKSLDDEYFRERHSDIENVVERILLNLSGDRPFSWEHLPGDLIIASRDFNPSTFAVMDLKKVRGLILESGGRTSHTAIISRGLRLPAVMGVADFLSSVATGDAILLYGDEGLVVLNPSQERIESVRRRIEAFGAKVESSVSPPVRPALTKDGTPFSLRANTELPHESKTARICGAEGIGLYRSEFLFYGHPGRFTSMEEQLEAYRALVLEMNPHPVAIRTLDSESDGMRDAAGLPSPANPSMGLRGIRLSLRMQEAFCTQIEAILRAGCSGKIEIVLPMISTVEEIWQAKALIEKVRAKLLAPPDNISNTVAVGAMIEVPAAVFSLETLAKEIDFLCVGTNDLIQYMMAVDRGNSQVAYLFQPLHPSVLRCLLHISETAAKLKKSVRICGEISSNPFYAVLLLGMGFTQLSMNPLFIPMIRRILQEVTVDAARQIAGRTLQSVTAYEAGKYLADAVSKLVSSDLTMYAKEIAAPNGWGGEASDGPSPPENFEI